MTSRIRAGAVALTAAIGLAIAPLLVAGPANAVLFPSVVFFSNADYTNVAVNDANQITALKDAGVTVTVFDGGNGSAAAWNAAITGKQAVVIPYSGGIFDTPVLSVAAAGVLKQYVDDGGTILLTTELQPELLSYLTDIDYTSVWWTEGSAGDTWPYVLPNPAFPAELAYTDEINAVDMSSWSTELLETVLPVYVDVDTQSAAVLGFLEGSGYIYTLGYDWYPGTSTEDVANSAVWNQVQRLLVPEPFGAEPPLEHTAELAATGTSLVLPAALAAGALLVAGGAVAMSRSVRSRP